MNFNQRIVERIDNMTQKNVDSSCHLGVALLKR